MKKSCIESCIERIPIDTALADKARTCITSSPALALRARICMSLQGAGEAGQERLQEGQEGADSAGARKKKPKKYTRFYN